MPGQPHLKIQGTRQPMLQADRSEVQFVVRKSQCDKRYIQYTAKVYDQVQFL